MNAEELVEALRKKRLLCYPDNCHACPYEDGYNCDKHMMQQAADMIELLQAQLNQCKEENEAWGDNELLKFATNLADELAESKHRERAAIEHLCRECRKICDKIYEGKTPCATCWWRAPEEGELNAETDNPD